jgi:hypothetical protein
MAAGGTASRPFKSGAPACEMRGARALMRDVGQRVASNVARIGESMNRCAQVELDERTQVLRLSAKHVSQLLPPKGERSCQAARRGKVAFLGSLAVFSSCPQTSPAPGSSNPFSHRIAGVSPVGPAVSRSAVRPRTPKQVLLQASAATALQLSAMSQAKKEAMRASESSTVPSPNNRMQRGVTHKVPRRGRDTVPPEQVMRARVRDAWCSRADAGRWAASQRHAGIEARTIPSVSFLYVGGAHIE